MTADELHNYVASSAGFSPADSSGKTCGDSNKSGLQCALYRSDKERCLVLGPTLKITPTMTCILDVTGKQLPDAVRIQELVTPGEVGLVDTGSMATCGKCDWSHVQDGSSTCRILTAICRTIGQYFKVADAEKGEFSITSGDCCDFWMNQADQKRIGW